MNNQVPLPKLIYTYLKEVKEEKSLNDIYQYISLNDLYIFNTATPKQVIRVSIERKTINTNFTDTHNTTLFYKKNKQYGLIEWLSTEEIKKIKKNNLANTPIENEEHIESIGEEVGEQLESLRVQIKKLEEKTENYHLFEKEYKNLVIIKDELLNTKQNFINEQKVLFNKFESNEVAHKNKLGEIVNSLERYADNTHTNINKLEDNFRTDINSTKEGLEKIKERAEAILKFSEQAGVAKYYQEKAVKKRTESWIYLGSFIFSIITAFAISLFIIFLEVGTFSNAKNIFGIILDSTGKSSLAIKTTLYIPILILSTFMWKMYADTKRLFEIYDHKSILAKSISINQKVLSEENDMDKEQIIERSTAKSLDSILESPFSIKHVENKDTSINKLLDILIKKEQKQWI